MLGNTDFFPFFTWMPSYTFYFSLPWLPFRVYKICWVWDINWATALISLLTQYSIAVAIFNHPPLHPIWEQCSKWPFFFSLIYYPCHLIVLPNSQDRQEYSEAAVQLSPSSVGWACFLHPTPASSSGPAFWTIWTQMADINPFVLDYL